MRKNFMILLIALLTVLIVAGVGAYTLLMPQYKTIDINGYKMEVPASDANVTSVNENYKTYDDNEHNITIKSYAINNVNETNYTGATDLRTQIGSNTGNNTTIENKTVLNSSGKYTYYDFGNYQMIAITSDNYNTIEHILKTMNKTEITPNAENTTINLMTISNNTTDTSDTTTTTGTSTKKSQSYTKTTSNYKKSSSDTFNGEPVLVRHNLAKDPNVEYIGTKGNIYMRDKKTGKTVKRYLDRESGGYYYK